MRIKLGFCILAALTIADGDTGKMIAKIKATGQREVMPWVPAHHIIKTYRD